MCRAAAARWGHWRQVLLEYDQGRAGPRRAEKDSALAAVSDRCLSAPRSPSWCLASPGFDVISDAASRRRARQELCRPHPVLVGQPAAHSPGSVSWASMFTPGPGSQEAAGGCILPVCRHAHVPARRATWWISGHGFSGSAVTWDGAWFVRLGRRGVSGGLGCLRCKGASPWGFHWGCSRQGSSAAVRTRVPTSGGQLQLSPGAHRIRPGLFWQTRHTQAPCEVHAPPRGQPGVPWETRQCLPPWDPHPGTPPPWLGNLPGKEAWSVGFGPGGL